MEVLAAVLAAARAGCSRLAAVLLACPGDALSDTAVCLLSETEGIINNMKRRVVHNMLFTLTS